MKEFLQIWDAVNFLKIDIIIFENPLQKLLIFTFWLFLGGGGGGVTLAKKKKKNFLEVVGRKRP